MSVTDGILEAQRRLKTLEQSVERYVLVKKRTATKSAGYDRALLAEAVKMARPMVVRYLLANYARSGLRQDTGRLRDAISQSDVALAGTAKRPHIAISFPSGLPDDKRTTNRRKKSVYVYGAALNFGAVYVPRVNRLVRDYPTGKAYTAVRPVLGQKAKKSLKKAALKEVYSHKVDAHLAKFGIKARPRHFTDMGKTIVGRNVRIVKPKRFYFLSDSQQADVAKNVAANYQRLKAQAAARN